MDKSHQFIQRGFLVLGGIAVMIGSYWLIAWLGGWAYDWSYQGSSTGIIIMKTNAALCLLLSGLTILLIGLKEHSRVVQVIATILAFVVFLIGAITVSEHILNKDFGIDQLLATELPGAAATNSPNRMGLIASTSLTLFGAGLLFRIRGLRLIPSYLGAIVCIINLVPAVGYLLKISIFFSNPELTVIAWQTIVGLMAIGFALLFSSGDRGIIYLLLSKYPGGELLRRLLPVIIVVPLALGILILKGENLELYDQITGQGMLIIATILLLLIFAILTARALNRRFIELKKYQDEIQSLAKFPSENPNPVLRISNDGIIQYSNEASQEILSKWEAVTGGKVPSEIQSMVNEILSDGASRHFEMESLDKIFSFVAVPVTGKGYINLYGMDITRRRNVEKALKESEEQYRMIVELSNEGIIIAGTDGHFRFINKRFADMLGYAPEEIIGRSSGDFFYDGEDLINVMESRTRLNLGKTVQGDMKFRRKDGSVLWTLYNATPLFDSDNMHYGNLAMHTDITKRKSAEEALRRSEERLRIAMQSGNVGIWDWDLKTNALFVDEMSERMFGIDPGSFEQTYEAFEKFVVEEDVPGIQKSIRDAIEKDTQLETIFRLKLKTGSKRYISVKGHLLKDTEGKPARLSGIGSDITELVESNQKLISKINEELLRSNRELENFAYVASHDLQEPLRMVTSFTQLLAHQYKEKLDDKAMEYINFAVDGSKRMYDLLNGLLTYSRINTRAGEFNKLDLGWAYDSAIKNLALLIKEKKVVIEAEELPVIKGDANQMIQLFQNLIANGIKFTPESPMIHISSKENHDHYLISVKDNGIGIESQYYEKIFQIFQRLNPRDKYEGTGVGLSICKRIVERHGGKIWLESTPGEGSTFHFTIPKIIDK